ncbi:MAG: ABC transporter permease subunit [Pseudomonadales bacterium]
MKAVFLLARAEFQESLRNRWALSAIILLASLAFALALLGSAPMGETKVSPLNITTVSLSSLSIYLIPLIALMLSFDTIVGERERGTLLLLLTYPVARWQVVVGKFAGHIAILAVTILLGYGSTGVYLLINTTSGAGDWLLYAGMMYSSLFLGAVFIALGYLLSVLVNDRATASGAAIAVWLFMVVIFDLLLLGLLLADNAHNLAPNVLETLILLNPTDVYRLFNLTGSEAADLLAETTSIAQSTKASPTALLVILFLWIAVPLASAILLFQRREL